jgi:hypothetical protein
VTDLPGPDANPRRPARAGLMSGRSSRRGLSDQVELVVPVGRPGDLLAAAPQRFVAAASRPTPEPRITFRVHLADRVLVEAGSRIELGQPLLERCRETVIVEWPSRPATKGLRPGDVIDVAHLEGTGGGSHGARPGDRARLIFHAPDGKDRVALGRHPSILTSPVDGTVETVGAGFVSVIADGLGLRADVGWGQPVQGRLLIGVSSPDAELRASAIDVAGAGAIVVAGARLDIEALTRARAIGVAGIICGGIVGRELRQLEESDRRQRAALHAAASFSLVALDGYGRRPIPGPLWDLLVAAAGRSVGLVPESHACVISGDPQPLMGAAVREPQDVRVTGGEGVGLEGRLVGLAGPVRMPGGLYAAGGFVDMPGPDGRAQRNVVPLADLERFG